MRVIHLGWRVLFVMQQCCRGGSKQDRVGRRHVASDELIQVAIEIAGVDLPLDHRRVTYQPLEEADIGFRPDDLARSQRFAQALQGLCAIGGKQDQLGDHRVIENRDRVAFDHAAVQPQRRRCRGQAQGQQFARTGQEAMIGIFGVQAHLDRVAMGLYLLLAQWQRLPVGYPQLPFNQIQPERHLGHRVLDLQARVHFHEKKFARAAISLPRDDEFHRAGADVVHRLGCRHRRCTHRGAARCVKRRRGRLLQDLLIAAL